MIGATELPSLDQLISTDAFTGEVTPSGRFGDYLNWAAGATPKIAQPRLIPTPADPSIWVDERIGWGIVLPERAGKSAAALATADDAPEPIRELVSKRGGKVLRYGAAPGYEPWTLRDYAGGGDRLAAGSPPGTGPDQLPMYLLIYGTPEEIPWEFQYSLNPVRHVGRLDLEGEGLSNYVSALLDGWRDSRASYAAPVVWSVDHGGGDITTLMREAIGAPMHAKLSADPDMTAACYIDGSVQGATGAALAQALSASGPTLIVTTSHGLTGPLADADAMRAGVGLPVDGDRATVHPDQLLAEWQPDGAIWFAQACCSAGAASPSAYAGLFEPGSMLDRVLGEVSALGAMTAPLPRALLGARRPLRAFIGRVEPTFNWTMSFPPNRQQLTSDLQQALYDRLCLGRPVGMAMQPHYRAIGGLLITRKNARRDYNRLAGDAARRALNMMLYSTVTAQDRASTVILGDPTVAIPVPKRG